MSRFERRNGQWQEWSIDEATEKNEPPRRFFVRADGPHLIELTSARVTSRRDEAREIDDATERTSIYLGWETSRFLADVLPKANAIRETFLLDSKPPLPPELIHHPQHYNEHPSDVETIDVMELLPTNLALAVKHLWRRGLKVGMTEVMDLRKARWYLQRELDTFASRPRLEASEETLKLIVKVVVADDGGLLGDVLEEIARSLTCSLVDRGIHLRHALERVEAAVEELSR